MAPIDSTCVLEALKVLHDAPGELLLPYNVELQAIVQNLQLLIDDHRPAIVPATADDGSPTTGDPRRLPPSSKPRRSIPAPLDVDVSSTSNNSEDPVGLLPDQPTPPQTPPIPPNPVEELVTGLNEDLDKIEKSMLNLSVDAVNQEPEWMYDDPRLVDLQIAGDGRQSSLMIKFRRGLSQRSLAIEFDDWGETTYGKSIVEERASNPSLAPSRRLGHIAKFLDVNRHRFHDILTARIGIEHGIKLLTCERLLGGTGFSAIFMFRYTRIRKIKYEELAALKDKIEGSVSIKDLAKRKAEWIDHCQGLYDGKWP